MVPVNRADIDMLLRFPRFADLPQAKLGRLAAAISVWRFQRRERIYAQQEPSTNLYILLRGVAKLSGYNKDRHLVLMALIPPGEVFGVSALLPESTHQFQCDAFTDCLVGRIDPQQFVDIMLGVPFVDFQTVLGMLASRSREVMTRYSMMLRLPVRDRLLTAFAELASKVGLPHKRGTLLNVPLTHQDLADLIGATRPIITLQLRDLERDGAIIRERRRLVLNGEKLANEGAIDPPAALFAPWEQTSAVSNSATSTG
jgi:CRP/FNR family transcriptional regulator, cyclic AMP receptor protein